MKHEFNLSTAILLGFMTFLSAALGSILVYKASINTDKITVRSMLLEGQAREIEALRKELRELRVEIHNLKLEEDKWRMMYVDVVLADLELRKEFATAITEQEVVQQWMDDMPFAGWAKGFDDSGKLAILTINKAFTRNYGLTREEAVGKYDSDLFPEKLATQYVDDDMKVIQSGVPSVQVNDYQLPDGTVVKMRNIKWRITLQNGTVGVAGMVIQNTKAVELFNPTCS